MRRDRRNHLHRGQDGVGLVVVLALGLVIMALGLVAHRIFDGAITSSSSHITYEQALHLAEDGIDQTLARIAVDPSYANAPPVPVDVLPGKAERAWARAQANAATPQLAGEGEFVAIKPAERNVVYGISWIPSRANARRSRVVKAEYLLSSFNPAAAVLTGGDLSITGSANVSGLAGNAHSNRDASIAGSASVSGDLSASGGITGDAAGVSGAVTPGAPPRDIPEIDPLTAWRKHTPTFSGTWYDLCPDASIRRPNVGDTLPCMGTVVASGVTGKSYLGWKLKAGSTWSFNSNDASFTGVFYAHETSIDIAGNPGSSGSPWRATLIASGKGSCSSVQNGDITIGGTPKMVPLIPGLGLLAGRDLVIHGNTGVRLEGLLAAREQVDVRGNATLNASIVAQDACGSGGSPVTANEISGSMSLVYNGDLEVVVGNSVRTTLWLEL